jgi:hypothetical protein
VGKARREIIWNEILREEVKLKKNQYRNDRREKMKWHGQAFHMTEKKEC